MERTSDLSRRGFMKGVLAGSVGLAAGGLLGCTNAETGATSALPEKWDYEADLVVVGMGAGGMTAAIYGSKAGLSVVALEKGSNVRESASSVCAFEYTTAGTSTQAEQGITDSAEQFMQWFRDTEPYEGMQKYDMLEAYMPASLMLYEWLLELGCECAGIKSWPKMDQPRLHTLGSAMPVQVMLEQCETNGVDIHYKTRATRLIVNDGRVVGCEATEDDTTVYVKARKGLLLACGGYEANPELMYEYHGYTVAQRDPAGSFNNTGDGFLMAWAVGAATDDMWVEIPSAVTFSTARGTAYGFYHAGGVLLNSEGKRFVNESETHTVEANALVEQTGKLGYVVSDATQTADPIATIVLDRLTIQGGEVFVADTIEDLAAKMGLPVDVATASIKAYNDNVTATGTDPEFGRDHILVANVKSPLTPIATPPFTGFAVMPANFYTEAGLDITPDGQVRDVWGEVIPGLYATGLMANLGGKYPFGNPQTLIAIGGAMTWGYYSAQHIATQEAWDAKA